MLSLQERLLEICPRADQTGTASDSPPQHRRSRRAPSSVLLKINTNPGARMLLPILQTPGQHYLTLQVKIQGSVWLQSLSVTPRSTSAKWTSTSTCSLREMTQTLGNGKIAVQLQGMKFPPQDHVDICQVSQRHSAHSPTSPSPPGAQHQQ